MGSVLEVQFLGSGTSSNETFHNQTGLTTFATGGSGTNTFIADHGVNEFVGGSGVNIFDANGGHDVLVGGASGSNTYNISSGAYSVIIPEGTSNTMNGDGPHIVL